MPKLYCALTTMRFWHGPCGKRGVVCTCLTTGLFWMLRKLRLLTRVLPVEARKHWPQWEMSNLPNANCAAGFCFSFFFVLGVCQPTKVRRQLLWSIESEHKGKETIMMLTMIMMMHVDDVKVLFLPGFCVSKHDDDDGMLMLTSLLPSPPDLTPPPKPEKPQKPAKTAWSVRHALAKARPACSR